MKDIEIWKTRFVADDVLEALDDKVRKKFLKLPESTQEAFIEKHKDAIKKGLESGIMNDWPEIMKTAINETDLQKDIEDAIKKVTVTKKQYNAYISSTGDETHQQIIQYNKHLFKDNAPGFTLLINNSRGKKLYIKQENGNYKQKHREKNKKNRGLSL